MTAEHHAQYTCTFELYSTKDQQLLPATCCSTTLNCVKLSVLSSTF